MHTTSKAFVWKLFFAWVLLRLCVADNTFNFEVAQRTTDNIKSYLEASLFPNLQISQAFRVGFMSQNDTNICERVRQNQFALLTAVSEIGGLTLVLGDDVFVSISRTHQVLTTTEQIQGAQVCNTTLQKGEFCVHQSHFGHASNPTDLIGTSTITLSSRGIDTSNTTASHWTPVTQIDPQELGMQFITPVSNRTGHHIGFISAALALSQLDSFLQSAFGGETDNRIVYIVEKRGGLLVAASVANVTSGSANRVFAHNCSNDVIRTSMQFLQSNGLKDEESLSAFGKFYVETTPYHAPGIDWYIVVVVPATIKDDYVATGSLTYWLLIAISSLSLFASVTLILWVVRFRHLRLWKAGQPFALFLVLVSNVLCALCTFVLVGAPTTATCIARQWMLLFSVTMTCAAFLVKLLRVYLTMRTSTILRNHVNLRAQHVGVLVVMILVFQIILLALWTLFDPMKPSISYSTQGGSLVGVERCKSKRPFFGTVSVIFLWFLLGVGCYLSFVTRNFSEVFAESRALMMMCFNGTFVGLALMVIALLSTFSTKTVMLLIVLGLTWFSSTTQVALVLPRIYRQVTLGDFTQQEIKQMVVEHLHKQKQTNSKDVACAMFPTATPQEESHKNQASHSGPKPAREMDNLLTTSESTVVCVM